MNRGGNSGEVERRKIVTSLVVSLWVVLNFNSCSSSPAQSILGEWQLDGLRLAFFEDGTVSRFEHHDQSIGTYRFLDEKHVRIEEKGQVSILRVSVSGDDLTITRPDGKAVTLRRVK